MLAEYAAHKRIRPERVQRFPERGGQRADAARDALLIRQLVNVFRCLLRRRKTALDAVKSGCKAGCQRQVRIAGRVRVAQLQTRAGE